MLDDSRQAPRGAKSTWPARSSFQRDYVCVCSFVDERGTMNAENPIFTFPLGLVQFPGGARFLKSALCDVTNGSDTSLIRANKTNRVSWVISAATLLPCWKNTNMEVITVRGPLKVNARA